MKNNIISNLLFLLIIVVFPVTVFSQSTEFTVHDVKFKSQGITLAGSILKPKNPFAAVVIVHGSDPVKREMEFAKRLAKEGIAVLTYDKRGVGESGGVYVGPSVGFSQAGCIIPITASKNPQVQFMVLFSCPTITTLEQLRFQFYTNGNNKFWDNHTDADAREHTKNDPDKYQFVATDPKLFLNTLFIPGLWLFGEKDIQIPVKLYIEQLNIFKEQGKLFEYTLFPSLGHNTSSADITTPFDISIQWIKQKTLTSQKK